MKLVEVEGYYDRGTLPSKSLEEGAERWWKRSSAVYEDPVLSRQSIGVVTFGSVQQNLVDDMLLGSFFRAAGTGGAQ
ncbi:MAG: hypothetical protein ACLR23_13715 [Clostridia bacterium]